MKLRPKHLVLSMWMFYKVLDVFNYYLIFLNETIDRSLGRLAVVQMTQALLGLLFLNFIINFLDRVWLPKPRSWVATIVLHIVVALVFAVMSLMVGMTYEIITIYPVEIWPTVRTILQNNLPSFFKASLLSYNFLIGIYYGMYFYEKKNNEELIRREVQGQLLETRLLYLKSQLNPHFLFNSLHVISTLMETDLKKARNMLADLSDLLRIVLDYDDRKKIRLEEELMVLQKYLTIEQTRFSDSFKVILDVEPGLEEVLLPPFLLQPIAENSIKYGEQEELLVLTIQMGVEEEELVIDIYDNGPGFSESYKIGTGISNTRDRIQTLYEDKAQIDFGNRPEGGAYCRIVIPLEYESTDRR